MILRFFDLATDALATAREEIDALNVFPVPDGDTGTNMFLTMSAARDAAREALDSASDLDPESVEVLVAVMHAFSRGALLGARGNSGVILSQILGAFAQSVGTAAVGHPEAFASRNRGAVLLAAAMTTAADAAYSAVAAPVEGTILTVVRAAADAAQAYSMREDSRTAEVLAVAAEAAREALERTPEQLQVLRDAGVVDAGGRGLTVILDAAEQAATGRTARPTRPAPRVHRPVVPRGVPSGDLTPEGPNYEVMYLLNAPQSAIGALRTRLGELGDSLVVVGADGLWNVHVHVDDVGPAIEAGIEAGTPYQIRVTHFADQMESAEQMAAAGVTRTRPPSRHQSRHQVPATTRAGSAVVAVSAGPGLGDLFSASGVHVVVGGAMRRPSTGQILEAILGTGAAEIVVLPNDVDSVRVAQIAASTAEEDAGVQVIVIPTHAQVQGLAALAVHDPGRSFETDVLEMTATASHVRHGAVTIAAKQAITMAGPCEPGDVLGVVAGDFAVVGAEVSAVLCDVTGRLLAGGGELVTLVIGAEAPDGVASDVAAWIGETYPHVDVDVLVGGQDRYPFLVSVE